MSGLIGNLGQFILEAERYQATIPVLDEIFWKPIPAQHGPASYNTSHWPGASGLLGSTDIDRPLIQSATPYYHPELPQGHTFRYAITGVSRDAAGSILPSCTLKLFRTSNDELVHQTISDPNTGVFTLFSQYYPDTHYIVAYKSGIPDVEGTTVNTLIGL